MIFTRSSHSLLFVGGILLLVALVADERGALTTVAAEAQTNRPPQEGEVRMASTQRPATPEFAEEAFGWDDQPVIDDAEFFDSAPDEVAPDNTFDDVFDPAQHTMDPAPVDDDDW